MLVLQMTCNEEFLLNMPVYFETFRDVEEAILREKRLKKWNRRWRMLNGLIYQAIGIMIF